MLVLVFLFGNIIKWAVLTAHMVAVELGTILDVCGHHGRSVAVATAP